MDQQTSPMTAERWMQLKKIFEAVQGKPPAEQAEMVCALAQGDEELETAAKDLLAADESAGSFLQTPAADLHSALLAPGTRLGPYQILGLLGEGGMGKVYRGLDTRLSRSVAIKVSAEQFSKRFAQEALAISALNHPNICTLYDAWRAPTNSRATRGKPGKPFKTSSPFGRTPTRIFLFSNKPRQNMPGSKNRARYF